MIVEINKTGRDSLLGKQNFHLVMTVFGKVHPSKATVDDKSSRK